jgi:Ca-activated chloride channel family protein
MSFGSPLLLLGLALIPLALLAQAAARRRRRRYAVRYTAVPGLRAAAAVVPAYKRILPAALLLAALASLVVALARPEATVAVAIDRATIMLVTDHSRSMLADDVQPNRLIAAQRAARSFIDALPGRVRIGAVAYSDTPDAVQAPSNDHELARQVVDGQVADGATATGDALEAALGVLERDRASTGAGRRAPSAIVLLSDGKTTVGGDPVETARRSGALKVPIYTVALGTRDATVPSPPGAGPFQQSLPAQPDPESLRQIAQASGGKAFTAEDDQRLDEIYKSLGSQLGTRKEQREISSRFAIGGMVLLLSAGLLSMRFAGRLP